VLTADEQADARGRGRNQFCPHRRAGAGRCGGDVMARDDLQQRARSRRPPLHSDWHCGSGAQPETCGSFDVLAGRAPASQLGEGPPIARGSALPQVVPSEHAIRLDAGFRNAPAERRSSAPARRPSSLVTWSQSPTPHTTAAPLHDDQHAPPFVCEQVRAHDRRRWSPASPGWTGSRGRVGGRGCWRSIGEAWRGSNRTSRGCSSAAKATVSGREARPSC
jgi:hypothetical protein